MNQIEIAVVIGAASGIGRGFVRALVEENIQVYEGDIKINREEQTTTAGWCTI